MSPGPYNDPADEPDRSGDQPIEGNCNARRTNGNGLCTRPAGAGCPEHPGVGQCYQHGGRTPSGNKAGRTKIDAAADAEVAEVARVAGEFGLWDRDVDHVETVQVELQRCAGMIDLCEFRLRQMDPDGFVWGITGVAEKTMRAALDDGTEVGPEWVVERTVKEEATLNAWIRLWHAERDRALKAAEVAHRIGMDQRQIELAEGLAMQMAAVVRAVGEYFGLLERPDWAIAARMALSSGSVADLPGALCPTCKKRIPSPGAPCPAGCVA